MEKLQLSVNLINAVLQYLDTRPHGEVRRLIDGIQQEAQAAAAAAQAPAAPAAPEEPQPE